MGNGAAKQRNQQLSNQAGAINTVSNTVGNIAGQERDFSQGLRSDVLGKYNDLYSSVGSGGGGGYTPQYADAAHNDYESYYKNLADTGGFDTNSMQDYRGRATATLPSFMEGLKNQYAAANRAAGGNVGYNSQAAKLTRDAAYGANQVALDAEASLHDKVLAGKEFGITGGAGLSEAYIQRKMQVERERNAAAASAAANARSNNERAFREKMAILGAQGDWYGKTGSDLPYYNTQLHGLGQAASAYGAQNTPSIWGDVAGVAGGVLGAVVPFLGGGKKKAGDSGYGNGYSGD